MNFIWMLAFSILFYCLTTEAQVHPDHIQHLIKKSYDLFEPEAARDSKKLTYIIDMGNPLVAAYADVKDERYILGIYGGLLTSTRLSYGSLAIILCHELGHIFGGQPNRPPPPEWDGPTDENGDMNLSAEGQADYYSTASCFRQLLKQEDHLFHLRGLVISQALIDKCKVAWKNNTEDYLICLRSGLAALDFLNLTHDFDISLDRHDPSVVSKTNRGTYPSRQCRLDTMVAGALCAQKSPLFWKGLVSPCADATAARPKCWFANP